MKKITSIIMTAMISTAVYAGGYKIGDQAKDFSLKNIDGKMVSMSDMKESKGIILIFTCNHCPFAIAYEDRIIALDKKFKPLGYPVVAVNPNDVNVSPEDSYELMIERSKEKNFTFPYVYDQKQDIAAAYGATRTPHVYVLQKEKDKLIVRYIGAIDNNTESAANADKKYVEDAVNALLTGKSVPLAETKAIGCTIKWKK